MVENSKGDGGCHNSQLYTTHFSSSRLYTVSDTVYCTSVYPIRKSWHLAWGLYTMLLSPVCAQILCHGPSSLVVRLSSQSSKSLRLVSISLLASSPFVCYICTVPVTHQLLYRAVDGGREGNDLYYRTANQQVCHYTYVICQSCIFTSSSM